MLCYPGQIPSCHGCLWLEGPPYSLQATGSLIWKTEDLYNISWFPSSGPEVF